MQNTIVSVDLKSREFKLIPEGLLIGLLLSQLLGCGPSGGEQKELRFKINTTPQQEQLIQDLGPSPGKILFDKSFSQLQKVYENRCYGCHFKPDDEFDYAPSIIWSKNYHEFHLKKELPLRDFYPLQKVMGKIPHQGSILCEDYAESPCREILSSSLFYRLQSKMKLISHIDPNAEYDEGELKITLPLNSALAIYQGQLKLANLIEIAFGEGEPLTLKLPEISYQLLYIEDQKSYLVGIDGQ